MTESLHIVTVIAISLLSAQLCFFIVPEIKRDLLKRKLLKEMENAAVLLKENIIASDLPLEAVSNNNELLLRISEIDEAAIKSELENETNIEDILYLVNECSASLNDLIAMNNELSFIVSNTRAKSEDIISNLDNAFLRSTKRIARIKGILDLAESSCDNADIVLSESYSLVEKSREVLQIITTCAMEKETS